VSRFVTRGRDNWTGSSPDRHYRMPMASDRPPTWQVLLLLALFIGSAAFLFWCGTFR
jgi:hypothetical protein